MVSKIITQSQARQHLKTKTYHQEILLFLLGTKRNVTTDYLCKNPSVLELPVSESHLLPSTELQTDRTAAVHVQTPNTSRSSRVNPFNEDNGYGECLLCESIRHDLTQRPYMRLLQHIEACVAHQCLYQPRS